nr:AAA family ATPase [uncultured Deefgea sp.]
MSLCTQDGYRDYLQSQKGLKENTINSYCSGLKHLSKHAGKDLFSLYDIAELDGLIERYVQGGLDEQQGEYGNWAASNALKHWREYVQQAAADISPRTWLLTWNPKHFKEGGDAGVLLDEVMRWTCHSKQPQIGDHFYLIRLGEDPRGLVASGIVTRTSFQAPNWKDDTKLSSYIEIKAEDVRPDCASGLLPILLLQQLAKDISFKWSAQSSGIEIPAKLASIVNDIWAKSKTKHSLQQYLDWSAADPEESRPDWLPGYQQRLELAKQIKHGQLPLDEAALNWLWRDGANGICSVKPAFLPNAAFEKNRDFLSSLTELVIADQSVESYQKIVAQWERAKAGQLFTQMYWGVIARVFSAFAPEIYTTLVMSSDPEKLLKCLASDFQLSNDFSGNWAQRSVEIRRCIDSIGAKASTVAETNIALWQLFKASGLPVEQADVFQIPVNSPPDSNEITSMTSTYPLNQILYGPPGTGKTYETIYAALLILEPEAAATYKRVNEDTASSTQQKQAAREVLKARFKALTDAQRIRFVTFHQSFSYEDFVEGLRANSIEGQIQYQVEAGVFKLICQAAMATPESVSLDSLLVQFIEQVTETPITLETATGKKFRVSYRVGNTTLSCEPLASENEGKLPANIEYIRSTLAGEKVENLYCASYVKGIAEHLRKQMPLPTSSVAINHAKLPYVLIIDEINRGNVSRIFGELITLIEPSKRAGAPEELEVLLPYSKKPFKVPDNVYLIGTMNTTDRSLAGLDIALRRRFSFKEMPPKPELLDGVMVDGVDVGAMLRVMNQRIAVLLDRDHCLGHAYFMPLTANGGNTLSKLAEIFQQNITPLLQEYFFEDWERIRWVLNDQSKAIADAFVVEDADLVVSELFAGVPDNKLRPTVRWRLNPAAFLRIAAYSGILNAQPKPNASELA